MTFRAEDLTWRTVMKYPWCTMEHLVYPMSRKLLRDGVVPQLKHVVDRLPNRLERPPRPAHGNRAFERLVRHLHEFAPALVDVPDEEGLSRCRRGTH